MPSFWDPPPPPTPAPWLPLLVIHIRSHVIKRQSQSYKFQKLAKNSNLEILQKPLHGTHLLKLLDKMCKYEMDPTNIVEDTEQTRFCPQTNGQTDILEKTQMCCDKNRWRFFCLLRIIQESGVYQLGVPQGQGDSSAPSTIDPLICGFCLATTPNTRGKTVEQSIVTWMFAREFITNRHPVAPQLTNKPCTNGHLRENTNVLW